MRKKLRSGLGAKSVIRLGRRLSAFFAILILLLGIPLQARADTYSVSLTSFEAFGMYGEIDLVWETASELGNSGFYIDRSTSLTGTKERILVYLPGVDTAQDFIYTTSDGLTDTLYEASDRNVSDNVIYYYWVESVPTSGSTTFSPSQSATTLVDTTSTVTAASTATPTATPTGTLTPNPAITSTGTVTPGGPTNTPTPTMIASPTLTRAPTLTPNYSLQATTPPLPLNTWTPLPVTPGTIVPIVPTETATLTSTPTLAPLPSITLLFPLVTDTGTPTLADPASPVQSINNSSSSSQNTGMSPDVILLIGVIILIWILLGAFLYFYIRHIGTGS